MVQTVRRLRAGLVPILLGPLWQSPRLEPSPFNFRALHDKPTPMVLSAIASASYQYRADFVSRNTYSCAFVGRSVTDSGIGFGLAQMMSLRRYQPSACSAKATRQGMPTRSLGLPHLMRGEAAAALRDPP